MSNLVPFRFRDDALDTVSNGSERGVTLASLCAPFGLDPNGQRQKLARTEWAVTFKVHATGKDGKNYETVCLDIRSINGWLFTLQTKSLSDAARVKLVAYQRECADVLADHFLGKRGAPESTALESAQTFAQQTMRVEDDPLIMPRMRRAIQLAALSTGRSWARIEGMARRTTGAPGWKKVALFNVPRAMAILEAIADGDITVPRNPVKLRALPGGAAKQLSNPFTDRRQ